MPHSPEPAFKGRVAIVTGAGKGLGRAYALWLAEHGASVVINNRIHPGVPSSAQALADQIIAQGGTAIAHEGAIDDPACANSLVQLALDHFGRLDVLVCNAGVMPQGPFATADLAELRRALDINIWGAIYPLQPAFRHMLATGYGRVVLTGSTVGLYGLAEHAAYATSRSAMVGLARSLAQEVPVGADIGVNVILPQGFTDMYAQRMPEARREQAARDVPAEKVAPVVGWLCSAECRTNGMIFDTGAGRVSRAAIIESLSIPIDELSMTAVASPALAPLAANEPANAAQASGRMKAGRIDI